jgi:hypothetical protein
VLDLFSDLTGLTAELRELRLVHVRIAEALERLSPPVRAADVQPIGAQPGPPLDEEFYIAESPADYEARIHAENSLAASLGVASWSPDFQRTIMEVRAELMQSRRYQDEEGNWQTRDPLTEDEADEAVRKGFQLARAEANTRR